MDLVAERVLRTDEEIFEQAGLSSEVGYPAAHGEESMESLGWGVGWESRAQKPDSRELSSCRYFGTGPTS